VAASLVPFLEHDDANRALMDPTCSGRRCAPADRAPFVGTGMESVVAGDSRGCGRSETVGSREGVDARRIVVRSEEPDASGMYGADIYTLVQVPPFEPEHLHQPEADRHPGQKVSGGEVIADGPATSEGDLALGRNVLVAFMPWGGYNFEDSILIPKRSSRKTSSPRSTSRSSECVARETKLGKEEISADIPNISEESLTDLDDSGIIRIRGRVKPMDILVGRSPEGETQLSPRRNCSRDLRRQGGRREGLLPAGAARDRGIVIDAKVFTRKGGEKDDRARMLEDRDLERLYRDQEDETRIILDAALGKIRSQLLGKTSAVRLPRRTSPR